MIDEMAYEGTVKFFNKEKGFGFIKCPQRGEDVFFHISNVIDEDVLKENDVVSFVMKDGKKGKMADGVTLR